MIELVIHYKTDSTLSWYKSLFQIYAQDDDTFFCKFIEGSGGKYLSRDITFSKFEILYLIFGIPPLPRSTDHIYKIGYVELTKSFTVKDGLKTLAYDEMLKHIYVGNIKKAIYKHKEVSPSVLAHFFMAYPFVSK